VTPKISLRPAPVLKGAAIAGFLLLGLSFTPNAAARMRCSYSGAPENLLTVTADREASGEIARRGQEIVVGELLERPSGCQGDVPTVLNTETISVSVRGDAFVDVLLGGGPFAPGATPETEGASEIEIESQGSDPFAHVRGTTRGDEFHWGPGPGRFNPGLNLNPGDAGDRDVDVTVRGEFASLIADGAAGNDTIVPGPGAPFPNEGVFSKGGRGDDRLIAPRNSSGILDGGPGDNLLIGGRQGDVLLGGDGNDRLRGAGGADLVIAGRGRDVIFGGPGRDRINSGPPARFPPRDPKRDTVRCGAGRDRVKADRSDRLRGCEVIRRRSRPTGS
jgi:hypothetical protein